MTDWLQCPTCLGSTFATPCPDCHRGRVPTEGRIKHLAEVYERAYSGYNGEMLEPDEDDLRAIRAVLLADARYEEE